MRALLVPLLAAALIGVACSNDDGGDATSSTTAASSTSEPDAPSVVPFELTAEPSTDLVDGDIVTVTADGLADGLADADIVVIGQCLDVEPLTLDACEPLLMEGEEGYFVKAADGAIEHDMRVAARFTTLAGELVDCREVDRECLLAVRSLLTPADEEPIAGSVPIAFDPDAALSQPGVSVSPTEDLVDGQALSVSLWGLEPDSPVFVDQCPAGNAECEITPAPRFSADGAGRVDGTVWAEAELEQHEGGLVSCRGEGSCMLRIEYPEGEEMSETEVSLSFDPDAPLASPPDLNVDPSAGVVDAQSVTVTGSGFLAGGARVSLVQCVGEIGPDNCDVAILQEAPTKDGALDTEVTLRAIVVTGDGLVVDCREPDGECRLAATTSLDAPSRRWGTAELAFDPDASLAPPPTLRIAEGDTFVDRTYVTVIGSRFPTGSTVTLWRCPTGAEHTNSCDDVGGRPIRVDDDGRFEATMPVLTRGGAGDCRNPGRCEIVATSIGEGPIVASRSAAAPVTVTEAPREIRYLHQVFDGIETLGPFVYGTGNNDGTPVELSLEVHVPAGDTATDRPVILFGNAEEFVPRGFVVVWPDIPVVGASRASIEQAYNNSLPALAWLADHADELGIDPDRIAAMGHSRGGFIATSLAYGPVAADGEASGLGAAISMAGGALPELIEPGEPPTLYFHGDQDTRAPFALVQDACATAEAVEVECRLVVYEGRGHPEVNDSSGDLQYDIAQKTAEYLIDIFELD